MTISTLTDCYLRHTSQEEQKLYDYLLYCVQTQSPSEILEKFRRLFIEGAVSEDENVKSALTEIVNSKHAEHYFKFVINRCCHILINRWQIHPQLQPAIPELVELFNQIQPPGIASTRTVRRLRQLVKNFVNTAQYLTLQRLARVISQNQEIKKKQENSFNGSTPIGELINRYPYLYKHCLLSEDSSYEHQQTVRQIQSRIQHGFELELAHYVTYQVRLAQIARQTKSLEQAQLIIPKVNNPTLLTERELGVALKQFIGNVHGGYTYRDLSHNFLTNITHTTSYQDFKDDLYEYLISSIDTRYGSRQFNQKLYKKLQTILPQCDYERPSEFLILRTSSQLLNFLVVESSQRPNHYVFVDMITNLGPTSTVGVLLKVALMCRKVKPYLEKRFSILFSHYEYSSKDGVPWLVKSLENLHIALSIHFGAADVSYLKQIM